MSAVTAAGRYALPAEAARAQVAAALAAVGLSDVARRPTHTLSGGQRQRCAIAGALAQMPKVPSREEGRCMGHCALAPHGNI
jgi:energy-coupling factor transporter ATP-binding protein EcfA2